MDLETALYQTVTNRLDRDGGPWRRALEEVRAAFGVRPPPGIPERTWRRARRQEGWTPSGPTITRLRAAQRRVRLSAEQERHLRSRPHVVLHAVVRVSEDERERKILVSGWPTSPDMGRVVDHYLRGDDRAGAAHFLTSIERSVNGPLRLVKVYSVRTFDDRGAALRWMQQ